MAQNNLGESGVCISLNSEQASTEKLEDQSDAVMRL